jgi:hypothetical protein
MDIGLFEILFGMFFTGLGGVLGYLGFKRNAKKDNDDQIRHDTKIDVKLDNIAKNVDEIRLDNKDFTKTVNALGERVTAVEQSTKQAHKRIDSLEELHLTK